MPDDDDLEPMDPREGAEEWLEVRRQNVARSTWYNNQTVIERFVDWCEDEGIDNLNDLTGRLMHRFVATRREKVKAVTLQKNLGAVREFLGWAADVEAVPDGFREKVHTPEVADGSEARDIKLAPDRAEYILRYLDRHHYASRQHVEFAILWRTGMRMSALRSIDVGDYDEDEFAFELKHRAESRTPLKNKEQSERWVYLGPEWAGIVDAYLANPDRPDVKDDYNRKPLVTTQYGRISDSALRNDIYAVTRPCVYGDECPKDRNIDTCEATGNRNTSSKCPVNRSPHAIRRGAITDHLLDDVPVEAISDRCDVSLEVLYQHYDARRESEKMRQRRKYLEGHA